MKKVDFSDIKGQEHVKRGLEVALSGRLSVLMIGPPGAGKNKLARATQGIDPNYSIYEGRVKDVSPTFIYTMPPCPCGYFTDPKHECHCSPQQIQAYLTNIPACVLNGAFIHLEVPRLELRHIANKRRGELSSIIAERVRNATIPAQINIDREGEELLKLAILELGISCRAYDKICEVAKVIAGLDGKEIIEAHYISEAISYRSLDRNLWG